MPCDLSKLPAGAKCTRCRAQATIRMPSHHANFCPDCFLRFFKNAVNKAMNEFGLTPQKPLLVAVSGGKDSLALWNILYELGYTTKGLHVDLGIEGFSEPSIKAIGEFARQRELSWTRHSLKEMFGYDLPQIKRRTRRKICSVCGMLKRQLLNQLAVMEGFDTVASGHNLDDEAGRLLGNLVRHRSHYLEKQFPYLSSTHPKLSAKAKPLYRLDAREIKIYCHLKGIAVMENQCPLSRGATSRTFKEALAFLEGKMPGTKRDFLFTFLDRKEDSSNHAGLLTCKQCGEISFSELCGVCQLKNHLHSAADHDVRNDNGHGCG
jgi:uncharacterized protein (TIGR00269 family)